MQIELASGVDVSDAGAAVAATDGGLYGPSSPAPPLLGPTVDAKSALNANHTASRTKLASHAQRAKDVPVNFS
jgi:hypothetical protein